VPELIREYTALFSELDAFVSSTAVSRVNGYVGGNGSLESLMKEIASLGLSPAGSKRLAGIVQEVNRSMHYAAKGSAFCPVPFTL
jgi:hypothetical protein